MEESDTQTTTQAPPTNRRGRPLSQTRSYHSILSSVRGSVRNGGSSSRSNSNSHSSSTNAKDKEGDTNEEEKPTDSPTEEEIRVNEATEDTKPESSNNASPQTEDHSKHSHNTKESKPNQSESVPKTPEDKRSSWTPRTSSIVDISRLRRPNSRSRMRSEASSSSSQNQDSAATRKDLTAVPYPEDKNSYNQISVTDKTPSMISPQETRPESVKESESDSSISSSSSASTSSSSSSTSSSSVSSPSSSLPSSSAGTRRTSSTSGRVTSSRSGAMYPNGRRVGISTRPHRLQTGKHKPDSSSFASSQSTLPTGTRTNSHDTTEEHDTNHKNTEQDDTKREQPTEETKKKHSDTTKEEHPEQKEDYDNKEEKSNGYGSTSHSSSRTNPSTTRRSSPLSLPNRNSRIATGSRRQDGRMLWSRTASSIGAGRPIIKGFPPRSTAVISQDTSDKTLPTTFPSKHEVNPVSNKPSVLNKDTNAPISFNNTSNNEDIKISNDHEDDYLYEGSRETLERQSKNATSTAAPKTTTTTTTTVSKPHRPAHNFENESVDREPSSTSSSSKSLPSVAQRVPILAFNGRVRSPVVASTKGLRFPSKVYRVQHRRMGSVSTSGLSPSSPHSSSASSSASSQNSPAESPLISNPDTADRSKTNVRLTSSSVSRSSHGLSAGDGSSRNISPESRNPVMVSRLQSISKENTPASGYKPSYEKGKQCDVCKDVHAVRTTISVCAEVHFYSFI